MLFQRCVTEASESDSDVTVVTVIATLLELLEAHLSAA